MPRVQPIGLVSDGNSENCSWSLEAGTSVRWQESLPTPRSSCASEAQLVFHKQAPRWPPQRVTLGVMWGVLPSFTADRCVLVAGTVVWPCGKRRSVRFTKVMAVGKTSRGKGW